MKVPSLVVPALAALAAGAPAAALELGPVRMESTLGQPLRASIAFALRPHEQIAAHCVRVATGSSASGLPSAGPAWVSVHDGAIHLVSERPVADPLVGLQLTVDCPYAAHLSREYVVFIDPPRAAQVTLPEHRVASTAESAGEASAAPAAAAPRAGRPQAAIAAGTSYRVRTGDTLSGIAARLTGRRLALWPTANRILTANPEAFIEGDPDRLRAGALLRIPDEVYAGSAVSTSAAAAVPAPTPAASAAAATKAPAPTPAASTAAATKAPAPMPAVSASAATKGPTPMPAVSASAATKGPTPMPAVSTTATTAYGGYATSGAGEVPQGRTAPVSGTPADALFRDSLPAAPVAAEESDIQPAGNAAKIEGAATGPRPGDILVDAEGLFVTPVDGGAAAPAHAEDATATTRPAEPPAERPASAVRTTASEASGGALPWLLGLGGSGVALILGLLLFGRLRQRSGGRRHIAFDVPVEPTGHAVPDAKTEHEPAETPVDFRFDDAEAEARIVRVDADLEDGRGFQETGDMDLAQDFGFAASGGLELGLDIDFSDAPPPGPRRREGDVIVEREVPPGDPTTSEYDLSMIVDATRQPLSDAEDTEKDLHAIELDPADGTVEEEPLTLSREVDYKILEQDYEEELTATQVLAKQLSSAARNLVDELYDPELTGLHELPTVEMPAPGTEATAEMPAPGEEATAEMPAPGQEATSEVAAPGEEATAEMPRAADGGDTTEMLPSALLADGSDTGVNEELTLVPEADNDTDVELTVESATIDTKKLKAS